MRIGLTNHIDFQIITDLYRQLIIKDRTANTKAIHEGFGDTVLRLKVNLMGNDPSEKFSIALLPYIKLPTNQDNLGNNDYEGGLGVPVNYNFDGGWSLTGMTQVNLIQQLDHTGYDQAYADSVMVTKNFTDSLSGYAEFYTYKADQSGAKWANTADFGSMYSVTDRLKIDANIALGVTDAADDFNFSTGTSYRF